MLDKDRLYMNVKLRLTGTSKEIDAAIEQLKHKFIVSDLSNKQKNRNSSFYRVYATLVDVKQQ